jgi:ABC-type uncharacterized transport system substrate-binding protein
MKTWSDGMVESWCVGLIPLRASLQYSNTPIPRKQLRLCLTLCAILYALCSPGEAQQPTKVPRIGYLTVASLSSNAARVEAFRRGLRELGHVEGKNIVIEWRSGEGKFERQGELAAEAVRLKVDVIVTSGPTMTRAAKEATVTIPIVMAFDSDPVGNGFVASLARPGGNITGLSAVSPDISGKQVELLKEMLPKLSRVAVLGNSAEPANPKTLREIELAAGAFGVRLQSLNVLASKDFETAFQAAIGACRGRHRAAKSHYFWFPHADCQTSAKEPASCDVLQARIRRSRRPDELCDELYRLIPPGCNIRR